MYIKTPYPLKFCSPSFPFPLQKSKARKKAAQKNLWKQNLQQSKRAHGLPYNSRDEKACPGRKKKDRVLIYDHSLFYVLNGAHFSIDVAYECHDPASNPSVIIVDRN